MSKQQQTITKQLQNLYSWTQFYQERGNKEQIRKIAEEKMEDMNAFTVEQAMKQVEGACRSMSIAVKK